MFPSIYDSCFMYTDKCLANSSRSSNATKGMVCLQTDDTAYACNNAFLDLEEHMSKDFDCKASQMHQGG